MIYLSELGKSLSPNDLNNIHGSGLPTILADLAGKYIGGKVAEDVFGFGGDVASATLSDRVSDPSLEFSVDDNVTLTPFGQ